MQYSTLIAQIEADIYSNGAELITGDILQTVLKRMVSAWASAGAAYGGTISPDTVVPLSLDQATVYLALTAGTYEHFLDGEGDPIETTGPALVIYDGGPALIFTKTDLPSGGSGATVITGGPGDSLVVTIPKGDEGIKASYRIDMTAAVYGGDVDARYIGSLIIECNELAMQTAHGYYYGDDMDEILSEVAIWKDDPEFYPYEQRYFLLLTINSDLDEVIFSVSSLDGQTVDADAANEDETVKVADANITEIEKTSNKVSTISGNETNTTKYPNTKAVADALGKMGVISQTQTWSGSGSGRTYTMSNLVTGLIPQAKIDEFVRAGATFNENTGYFEMNGLTDLSYNEMMDAMRFGDMPYAMDSWMYLVTSVRTNFPPLRNLIGTVSTSFRQADIEAIAFYPTGTRLVSNGAGYAFYTARNLKRIVGVLDITASTSGARFIQYANLLESFQIKGLKFSVEFSTPYMDKASLLYLINNEASTSAIVITLEASVYAKTQTGGEWKADVDAALANHPNVQLGQ